MQKEKVILASAAAGGLALLVLGWNKVSQMFSHKALAATVPPGKAPLNPVVHSSAMIASLSASVPHPSTLGTGPSVGAPRVQAVAPPPPAINAGIFTAPLTTIFGSTTSADDSLSALSSSAPGGTPPTTVTSVKDVQRALNYLNIASPPLAEDGVAGPLTKAATRTFQTDNPPLAVDGIAGPQTKAALYAAVKEAG